MSGKYVYVIQEGDSSVYKIGYTARAPDARMAELQTGNYRRLVLIGYIRVAGPGAERDIHSLYADKAMGGEWFRLSVADVFSILGIDARPGVQHAKPAPTPRTPASKPNPARRPTRHDAVSAEQWRTRREIADLLGVSERTVTRRVSRGEIFRRETPTGNLYSELIEA